MSSTPQTDREWAIHSINIHGIFFERWCQSVVSESPGWTLNSANYPVEFPPANGPIRGKESTLDIRASREVGDVRISLLIECKKNNPNFVDWVFFQKPGNHSSSGFIVSQVKNEPRVPPAAGWDTSSSLKHLVTSFPLTDEARETRGSYGSLKTSEKTKTSNASIQDAAYQVALAKQAIAHEDDNISRRLGSFGTPSELPWRTKLYFPTIVTTARLHVCTFNPEDVDSANGEVPLAKASISERQALVFEYALPRHLQFAPLDTGSAYSEGLGDLFTRLHILVVQSQHLPEFLRTFYGQEPDRNEIPAASGSAVPTDA